MARHGSSYAKAAGEETMSFEPIDYTDVLKRIAKALERIAENTRPEKGEEPKSRVRGFAGDDLNGGDRL